MLKLLLEVIFHCSYCGMVVVFSAVLGVGYGIMVANPTFIQINSISTAFNTFYIGSYIYCSTNKVSQNSFS